MKKKEGTSDSIEKNRRSRSVNRLSSQVDRNDGKKKERERLNVRIPLSQIHFP